MSFINGDGTLNKGEIINHFLKNFDVWYSQELRTDAEAARSVFSKIRLETEQSKDKDKVKREYSSMMYFVEKIKALAKKYTPYDEDENRHKKNHPTEPHLRDSYEIYDVNYAFGEAIYLVNRNSYAAAVHEDAQGRKPYHKAPTRSGYLLEAALEVSATYSNPYNIYLKIGPEEVAICVTDTTLREDNEGFSLTGYIKTKKYFERVFPEGKKELNRREVYDLEKLSQTLKGSLDSYFSESEEKNVTIPGFKLLVKAEPNSEKFNKLWNTELAAQRRWDKLFSEDDDDLYEDDTDNMFDDDDSGPRNDGLDLTGLSDMLGKGLL